MKHEIIFNHKEMDLVLEGIKIKRTEIARTKTFVNFIDLEESLRDKYRDFINPTNQYVLCYEYKLTDILKYFKDKDKKIKKRLVENLKDYFYIVLK